MPNRSHQSNFKYASKTGTVSVKEPNLVGDCRDETLIVSRINLIQDRLIVFM